MELLNADFFCFNFDYLFVLVEYYRIDKRPYFKINMRHQG
jgi:hypothetical protein